ncbi:MAG TPA: amino acid permease [Steroidobacteraceae bacterium]|nr:amino acid permease [Steroidobacteraceae bacterium]
MSEARDAWGERLPRRLGVWSAVAVLIGTTVGAGIFRVPALVAASAQDPSAVLLAWVLGGAVSLCGALAIAELAGAMPRSGGIFVYIWEGFGPLPAFLFGWAEMLVIRPAALGGIATICAEHAGHFVPLSPLHGRYLAAVLIAGVGIINYSGTRRAAAAMNFITGLKFAALAILAILAFGAGRGSFSHFHSQSDAGTRLLLAASPLIPILWTYDGWSNLSFVGGEIANPQKNLPLALILGTAAIIALYLSINAAFIYLVPVTAMAHMPLIAAAAASRIPLLHGYGPSIVAATVIAATLGSLIGCMMTGPRVVFAMAERGLFFAGIARISPRFSTPSTAIALSTLLGVALTLASDFAHLVDRFVLGSWPFYALAVAAVFVLRRRRPEMARPYRAWGYPVVPALFLLASVAMVIQALWTDPLNTLFTFAVILAGVPVYLFRKRYGTRH